MKKQPYRIYFIFVSIKMGNRKIALKHVIQQKKNKIFLINNSVILCMSRFYVFFLVKQKK